MHETLPSMTCSAQVAAGTSSARFIDSSKLRAVQDRDWFLRPIGQIVKTLFIEIYSQGEGGRFKKSDISYAGGAMGLEALVSLGFRYYKGR